MNSNKMVAYCQSHKCIHEHLLIANKDYHRIYNEYPEAKEKKKRIKYCRGLHSYRSGCLFAGGAIISEAIYRKDIMCPRCGWALFWIKRKGQQDENLG